MVGLGSHKGMSKLAWALDGSHDEDQSKWRPGPEHPHLVLRRQC